MKASVEKEIVRDDTFVEKPPPLVKGSLVAFSENLAVSLRTLRSNNMPILIVFAFVRFGVCLCLSPVAHSVLTVYAGSAHIKYLSVCVQYNHVLHQQFISLCMTSSPHRNLWHITPE